MTAPFLRIHLFGDFRFDYDNTPVTSVNTSRLQSLLAYLILHANAPQSRQQLAFLLWSDTTESNARNNLRQCLHQLRQALPDPERFLVADANTLGWQTDKAQGIDVQLFTQALGEAKGAERRGDAAAMQHFLESAVAQYQGELLPGCYDDWIASERDHLRQECHHALEKLTRILEAQREYGAALRAAQQLLRLDRLTEGTYVTLMRLHMLNEDPLGARRAYQNAVETFQRELGVEPGENLRAAFERLQVLPRTSAAGSRNEAEQSAPSTLVGRGGEWHLLQQAWSRAASGDAHLVLITGEAGIGKSRLAEELFYWATQQSFTAAGTRSYAAEGRLSLAPVTDWLRSDAIHPHLKDLDNLWLTEVSRLLPELLTERVELARPEPIGEYGQRQRFFEALARAVLNAPQPILLWIDDLQWCDSETLEWLHFLLRYKSRTALLVIGTARSEELPAEHELMALTRQLRIEGRLTAIELSSLDAAETAKLAMQIGGSELDVPTAVRLFRETEGNPLFVVETVRASGGGGGFHEVADTALLATDDFRTLPPRVYAVIAGRLAQLSGAARKVAELGAVIGRAFSLELLQGAGNADEEQTIHALDELWQKRIVREQSANLYDFTHDKLREVAYIEIRAPQRRLLHRRIAQALEALNKDTRDAVSAEIAAHYEQAGMFEQAIPYYKLAGGVAESLYANDDAIRLYKQSLELLGQLPPSDKRDVQELALLVGLARVYRVTKGWAWRDLSEAVSRAWILGEKVGNNAQRVETLFLLQSEYVVAARFDELFQRYDEMRLLALAESPYRAVANIHYAGAIFHSKGQFIEARDLFEGMIAELDSDSVRFVQRMHGANHLVIGYAWNSHLLWCLGYPQQALESCREGVRNAREFAHRLSQALALAYLALLQELRADNGTFRIQAEEARLQAHENQAMYYLAWSNILVHFAEAQEQPNPENRARLREAIRVFSETGARLRMPYYLSLLVRVLYKAGQLDEGFEVLGEAFAESTKNKEHWWDAELYRLRGELLRARGAGVPEVEAAFRRAIQTAQAQQAKSLELRGAMSMARLWQRQKRTGEARQLLAPVYEWFSEGFDTPDLQAAQALLAQLERD